MEPNAYTFGKMCIFMLRISVDCFARNASSVWDVLISERFPIAAKRPGVSLTDMGLIPVWISKFIKCGMKLLIHSQTSTLHAEVWEWESNFIPHFAWHITFDTYLSILGLKLMLFVVCFITKSFLTYSFFFHLHLLYQPYPGLCQAQCVQSHQRQPMSAVAITACEVQVSAADSQTVPTVATGV